MPSAASLAGLVRELAQASLGLVVDVEPECAEAATGLTGGLHETFLDPEANHIPRDAEVARRAEDGVAAIFPAIG